jgi:hypothetical protein
MGEAARVVLEFIYASNSIIFNSLSLTETHVAAETAPVTPAVIEPAFAQAVLAASHAHEKSNSSNFSRTSCISSLLSLAPGVLFVPHNFINSW